jgi:transposase InsO family protein
VHASSVSSVTRSCWPEIKTIHRAHPDYGSPRVTVELARRGRPVNHKRVESMMAAAGIVARRHRRRRGLTKRDETAAPLPDLVGRLFDPGRMDHTWVGNVTFVPTDEGWLYLATVLDLGSRRLIGYAMSDVADTDHVINAVAMAVAARGRATMGGDTIFHSDRGSTYASGRYRQACIDLGLRQSAGRTGSCLDNAGAESFFATLIQELGRRHFATRADAGYRPPVEYEQQLTVNQRHVGSRQAA